ncbi:YceI family protein [Kiloniella sp. b19]|uniref:YceI family protein n=1 Tax=Kiloniella sp. GXU_MW_B19 TaxID=3141326 RepID=UPI0031D4CDE6
METSSMKMTLRLLASVLFIILAIAFIGRSHAQAAPLWTLTDDSSVGFTAEQSGAPVPGKFEEFSSEIKFHPDQLDSSSIRVVIQTGSVNTEDNSRDGTIRSGSFFDSDSHPEATFEASSFEKTGDDQFVAKGTLNLRGTSNPLELPFTASVENGVLKASGSTTLERLDYGVGIGEWASTAVVSNTVEINFDIIGNQ